MSKVRVEEWERETEISEEALVDGCVGANGFHANVRVTSHALADRDNDQNRTQLAFNVGGEGKDYGICVAVWMTPDEARRLADQIHEAVDWLEDR